MAELPFPPLVLTSGSSTVLSAAGAQIILHNLNTSKTITSPQVDNRIHQNGFIRHLAISNDEKIVASVGDDKNLKLWDVTDDELKLRSTRGLIKKASHIILAPDNSIIISDKVGDVYSYPLDPIPSDPSTSRPPMYSMVSDPTKNPDCTYLLGHVSVTTQHLITPDHKHIITADRDEHIRISRYPKAYVIERQLFGHDGFVSSLHIPTSSPNTLLSGGGDSSIRIWDWPTGKLLNKVDIYGAVLPQRKVRSYLRKNKWKGRFMKTVGSSSSSSTAPVADEGEETFYSAPEGYVLPTGQGVCIKKIDSVQVEGQTIVLFFSEGASALHSFVLPSDPTFPTTVNTQTFPYPILDFTALPSQSGKILVSLDTAWGVLKKNPGPGTDARQDIIPRDSLSNDEQAALQDYFRVIDVNTDGQLSINPSDIPATSAMASALPKTDIKTLSNLNLYPLLNILPRWPGLEDDDGADAPISSGEATPDDDGAISLAPTSLTTRTLGGTTRSYSMEELEGMNLKVLGRLKSNGVDVGSILRDRQKKAKEERKRKVAEANKKLQEEKKKEEEAQGEGPDKKKKKQKQKKEKKVVMATEEDMANA
ncbi:uncharacterized protein I303_106260 [Kwoniella dejecticola CBS 10117]|uniref:Transfer RNA methyltransferase 82 n=1 Tax=Kwoniella dejecticola CBS 10117 TaxID=1296121 RepID=A0A1A6A1Q4_9TREE|nr:uncharacterized protein I303_06279 [Kwoniella dejecticola CBS 10117]OBR83992.1 hypothetical protein I303_06279 [Kwoniella dejecticola CBS 10117]